MLPSCGNSKEARGKGNIKLTSAKRHMSRGAGQRSMAGEQQGAVMMRSSAAINGTYLSNRKWGGRGGFFGFFSEKSREQMSR